MRTQKQIKTSQQSETGLHVMLRGKDASEKNWNPVDES